VETGLKWQREDSNNLCLILLHRRVRNVLTHCSLSFQHFPLLLKLINFLCKIKQKQVALRDLQTHRCHFWKSSWEPWQSVYIGGNGGRQSSRCNVCCSSTPAVNCIRWAIDTYLLHSWLHPSCHRSHCHRHKHTMPGYTDRWTDTGTDPNHIQLHHSQTRHPSTYSLSPSFHSITSTIIGYLTGFKKNFTRYPISALDLVLFLLRYNVFVQYEVSDLAGMN